MEDPMSYDPLKELFDYVPPEVPEGKVYLGPFDLDGFNSLPYTTKTFGDMVYRPDGTPFEVGVVYDMHHVFVDAVEYNATSKPTS
jgi:hypothetical protein